MAEGQWTRKGERGEVKGRIVAAAVAKGGEGWRGKRGRCSHTKKLKGNPTAIGSATQECIEFRQRLCVSRSNIHARVRILLIVRQEYRQDTSVYAALSCKVRGGQRTSRRTNFTRNFKRD